jgi:hypothetical protein
VAFEVSARAGSRYAFYTPESRQALEPEGLWMEPLPGHMQDGFGATAREEFFRGGNGNRCKTMRV